MNYSVLADRVRYFKGTEEGVTIMCGTIEEMRNETVFKTQVKNLISIMEDFKVTVQEGSIESSPDSRIRA
ncbi:MAG: hypothetical protein IKU20_11685 [Lachnospiraceae bacterium]|nr:hypothetical protein [Lachnospiraceae bacterium]